MNELEVWQNCKRNSVQGII